MLLDLTMPQFGESITKSRIVQWLKKEGDDVKEQEPIAEMETEKSVFSYESPFRGKIVKILRANDADVPVGESIAQFEVSGEDGKKYLSMGIGKPVGGSAPQAAPEKTEKSKSVEKTQKEPEVPLPAPVIRSLAKEHGVSLEDVQKIPGTGSGGRVTKEDFLKHLNDKPARSSGHPAVETQVAEAPLPAAPRKSPTGVKIIPVTPVRARIAENMVLSKQTVPHAGTGLDADLSVIEAWRLNHPEKKLGYLAFIVSAAVESLMAFPIMNSVWKEGTDENGKKTRWIEEPSSVRLGVAVATPQGLMVPVIPNADQKNVEELALELNRVVQAGRESNLKPHDLSGGTFTINNTGSLGALRSVQVIPPGQSAILAINRVVRRPVVVGTEIVVRPLVSLDLTFDHRLIDGAEAIGFLVDVVRRLENFDFSDVVG